MQAPDRAPRRDAASMNIDLASGVPSPGNNSYQSMRHSSGLTPGSVPQTKGGGSGDTADGGAYDRQRAQANVGLTPGNVAINEDTSPQVLP